MTEVPEPREEAAAVSPDRDSAPPVAGPPAAPAPASTAAADGLTRYLRGLLGRVALLIAGAVVLGLSQRWSLAQLRLALAADGMGTAVTTLLMMAGLNRFARAEEDGRAGGMAIGSVLVLLLELVVSLYGTKLELDLANDSADVVLVYHAVHSLPIVRALAHALGLAAALILLAALRKVTQRLGDVALGRRIAGAAGLLGMVVAGALILPLVQDTPEGFSLYEMILFGVAAAALVNFVIVVFAVRRAMIVGPSRVPTAA